MKKLQLSLPLSLAVFLMIFAVISAGYFRQPATSADNQDVVINEIMYNPASGNQDDEYLELHNTSLSPIDMQDWCFTAGITLVTANSNPACFTSGTTIAAGGYLIVSPNPTRTLATYGLAATASYAGSALGNGGERITLVDASTTTVDTVDYDDASPWPITPDGSGPSLELQDPESDNSLAVGWSASLANGGTPLAINSVSDLDLPVITDVSKPTNVQATDTPTITAHLSGATSVSLTYKVMFSPETTVAMLDDGAHGDGASGDGVFGFSIPAQTAGDLIRYKVSSVHNNGTSTSPSIDDSIIYYGYTVQDTITTQLPILQWFIDPDELEDLVENHSQDDFSYSCVIAYGNTVIDNASVHIKGSTTRNLPKKAFAVDLPRGYKIQFAGMTTPIDEFHLNSTALDNTKVADVLAWDLAKQIGMPTTQMFKIRLQGNGSFYGLYTFAEEYDKQWRDSNDYSDGSFYKGTQKRTRESFDDGTELMDWRNAAAADRTDARRDYILDTEDIPNMISTMAFETFIRNVDSNFGVNMLAYHDITDTGRWQALPYDLDGTGAGGSADLPGYNFVSPYEVPDSVGRFDRTWRSPFLAVYDEPDLRQAYYRRLRTLADDYLATGWYRQHYQDLVDQTAPEFQMDFDKWGSLSDIEYSRLALFRIIDETKFNILSRFQKPWAVPETQSADATIDIDQVVNSTANRQEDYIILKNNSSESIDLSGWQIPELEFTFPIGSALGAGQSAYVPRKDSIFKSLNSPKYVLGQLKQDIPITGTLTLERKDSSVSSTKNY